MHWFFKTNNLLILILIRGSNFFSPRGKYVSKGEFIGKYSYQRIVYYLPGGNGGIVLDQGGYIPPKG